MADLAATLAAEGQRLPIDVPRAGGGDHWWCGGYELERAATLRTWHDSRLCDRHPCRRWAWRAVQGGGRVVKNVAGYDFCKLLTGSLGTLGVITQLALKVKPQHERAATIIADCDDWVTAEAGRCTFGEFRPRRQWRLIC